MMKNVAMVMKMNMIKIKNIHVEERPVMAVVSSVVTGLVTMGGDGCGDDPPPQFCCTGIVLDKITPVLVK